MCHRTTLHTHHSITRTHAAEQSRLLTVAAGSLLLIYQCHTSLPSISMFSDTLLPLMRFPFLFSLHICMESLFFSLSSSFLALIPCHLSIYVCLSIYGRQSNIIFSSSIHSILLIFYLFCRLLLKLSQNRNYILQIISEILLPNRLWIEQNIWHSKTTYTQNINI